MTKAVKDVDATFAFFSDKHGDPRIMGLVIQTVNDALDASEVYQRFRAERVPTYSADKAFRMGVQFGFVLNSVLRASKESGEAPAPVAEAATA